MKCAACRYKSSTSLGTAAFAVNILRAVQLIHASSGLQQVGKAMSVPPAAVLGGLLINTSFVMSPAVVKVPGTKTG